MRGNRVPEILQCQEGPLKFFVTGSEGPAFAGRKTDDVRFEFSRTRVAERPLRTASGRKGSRQLTVAPENLTAAVERLERASARSAPCEPVADLLGPDDIDAAYEVQRRITERRISGGARLVGRKIGLTSRAVQAQIGVNRPDFGVLFDDMQFADGAEIPFSRLLQPKAEAEIAFLLAKDILDASDLVVVRDAVAQAFPSLEVVDSRIADWRIGITDTVADNASSGVFVIGAQGVALDAVQPADVVMTMLRNGEVVSQGTGRDCLDDPLNALAWLARTAIEIGAPLRAGDIVLSGALGPMVPVRPGDVFEAKIEPLGTIIARFSKEEGGEQ
ncbi:2-keto-4-pentenoate hydratase [Agrobacterium rhizogenes]|nr:2-keto-4-pentenoate hydratase [Rhizobium rhizogenes]NTG71558.1 2-keto-4-pentenoate hydratase [Rhizobium rhizogenes]NTG84457.1 2-keto-4-pentenoate hydratase [Rhizobium rhizogenes]NTG90851.1 2-keto-4-pentenoate hydratase [Rhizobium rhizogenes]NTH29485.1 2-keto-4-pentenoate hydratase [Rhizobium rhizogenes]